MNIKEASKIETMDLINDLSAHGIGRVVHNIST